MLIIRETFTAKPGQASKFAKLFRRVFADDKSVRIMTDLIGEFNTIVMETEVKNLGEFEQRMKDYASGKPRAGMDAKAFEEFSKYADMYVSGKREIFNVVE